MAFCRILECLGLFYCLQNPGCLQEPWPSAVSMKVSRIYDCLQYSWVCVGPRFSVGSIMVCRNQICWQDSWISAGSMAVDPQLFAGYAAGYMTVCRICNSLWGQWMPVGSITVCRIHFSLQDPRLSAVSMTVCRICNSLWGQWMSVFRTVCWILDCLHIGDCQHVTVLTVQEPWLSAGYRRRFLM
jgi:hypothetical protein